MPARFQRRGAFVRLRRAANRRPTRSACHVVLFSLSLSLSFPSEFLAQIGVNLSNASRRERERRNGSCLVIARAIATFVPMLAGVGMEAMVINKVSLFSRDLTARNFSSR